MHDMLRAGCLHVINGGIRPGRFVHATVGLHSTYAEVTHTSKFGHGTVLVLEKAITWLGRRQDFVVGVLRKWHILAYTVSKRLA